MEPVPVARTKFQKPSPKRKQLCNKEGNNQPEKTSSSKRSAITTDSETPEPTQAEFDEFLGILNKSDRPIAILSVFPDQQELVGQTPSLQNEVTLPEPLLSLYSEINHSLSEKRYERIGLKGYSG